MTNPTARVLVRTLVVALALVVLLGVSMVVRAFGSVPLLDQTAIVLCLALVAGTFVVALSAELIPSAIRMKPFLLGGIFTAAFFASVLVAQWMRIGLITSPDAATFFGCLGIAVGAGAACQLGALRKKLPSNTSLERTRER